MGRKLRTTVPTTRKQMLPKIPHTKVVRERDYKQEQRQEKSFNTDRGARELPELSPGKTVWVPDRNSEAVVQEETNPRSYEVETSEGVHRRNIVQLPEQQEPATNDNAEQQMTSDTETRRSNSVVQPPERYDPSWLSREDVV